MEKAHLPNVRDLSWSNNGFLDYMLLASGGDDNNVKIWRIEVKSDLFGMEVIWNKTYESPIWKTSFNFSGNLLAVAYTNAKDVNVVEVLAENDKDKWEPVLESKNEN